ncbi:hypothetical protein AL503_002280 [Staphylococcus haemolyticus]|uniref:Uncharacterized protein n=1 Tax=Staphylococcus haemolyticus TaxID=1283 RepID=A0A2K0AXB1_STAHA|nr:hypothetical protein AL503_002280 [Staphylococcus haemolyticus]
MISKNTYVNTSKFNIFIIYIIGFIFGIFLTKTFVYELKDDTKEYDFIMYQFYRAAIYGYKFRFLLFIFIGPVILLSLLSLLI